MQKKRIITIKSGKEAIQMEVTEEEYQNYYRPWWQQKKKEQRNREAMAQNGYSVESYEAWRNGLANEMGVPDMEMQDMNEIIEKKVLLEMLEEALDSLVLEERELAIKIFGEGISVCEFARIKGEKRRTLASRKERVLKKLRDFFEEKGVDTGCN
ncbi:sigma-70 family RNA polymerase sigma factor [Robinsoniella peoriensis]|uniref:sigma-70 family RNA polymerase sigma factor n=1 Tax=Robinsoniella peoriensis TaxID=180332 RepID=UPI00375147A8